jgi:hypothetical protein
MTQDELIDRVLLEIRSKGILPTEDYTPSPDHYIPIRFFKYYLQLAYSIGFDEGSNERHARNRKSVIQYSNGKKIQSFESITKAAKSVKGDRANLTKQIGTKVMYKGFTWEMVK